VNDPESGSGGRPVRGGHPLLPLPGDPISDVLETIRLKGAVFFVWEPGWPFAVGVADGSLLSRHALPGTDCIVSYHIVTQGPCWAAVNGEAPLRLESGDTLVLPRGDPYKIASEPAYPSAVDEAASIEFFKSLSAGPGPAVVTEGGPGPGTSRLICGFLGCSMGPFNPLLSTLPRMMRVPAPGGGDDPLSSLIAFALTESRQSRGGERCLLQRLSEVMFVEVLRRYWRSEAIAPAGWLAGLRDPVVGRALSLLHGRVADPWTLQSLAERAGASRSTLAGRFTGVIGMPPMQYLARWRMQLAASRLSDKTVKIFTVANEVGYESEAAFSRAFKRIVGATPRQWRERA